jgi:hypothetical protein
MSSNDTSEAKTIDITAGLSTKSTPSFSQFTSTSFSFFAFVFSLFVERGALLKLEDEKRGC